MCGRGKENFVKNGKALIIFGLISVRPLWSKSHESYNSEVFEIERVQNYILNFLIARVKATKWNYANFSKPHAEGFVFFVSLNKFWLVNMYELFNVHVNKANENTNSPMVTLRIIKGTIFYATAAFLMAPSVRSTKEVWSLTDSVIVMFTLSVGWNFIAYWLSLMSDWSTGTSHIICYVNEIMIALKILIRPIALICWITGSTSTEI